MNYPGVRFHERLRTEVMIMGHANHVPQIPYQPLGSLGIVQAPIHRVLPALKILKNFESLAVHRSIGDQVDRFLLTEIVDA